MRVFLAILICLAFSVAAMAAESDKMSYRQAEQIINFHNRAQNTLSRGYYTIPDRILKNAQAWQRDFKLPQRKLPGGKKNAHDSLVPQKGLFNEKEMKDLATALDGMDSALQTMLDHFESLKKYIADDSIQDDGKLGEALGNKILAAHGQFMAARKSWLGIVENRAQAAEAVFLEEHPLQRQIVLAQKILTQIREVGQQISAGNKGAIPDLLEAVRSLGEEAAKPPFAAKPGVERIYRTFLGSVSSYGQILDRAIKEGLLPRQQAEVRQAAIECGKAYNNFAAVMNGDG